MKREYLGSILTDTATILVGDPCQLLTDDQYEGFIEDDETAIGRTVLNLKGTIIHKRFGGAISARTGSDGWCPVWLEEDEAGKPLRLAVSLNPRMDPDDGAWEETR